MATVPIFNPQCPFLAQIPGRMRIGSNLKVRARLHGPHNRLNIYVQKGAALRPRDDVVLHLSVRGDERSIIRNSMRDQIWGNEERYGGFPIHGTASFEISITAEPNSFRISVNGHPHFTFGYRLPIDQAEFISVDGQAAIESITCEPNFTHNYPVHPIHPPIHVHPNYPVNHYPPAPPPMPVPVHPPPYPGHYPDHATPFSENNKKSSLKLAASAGIVAGVTAVALTNASRNLRRRK